jgi:hypothetical protein
LFPHQYGGSGWLHDAWRGVMHVGESAKRMFISPKALEPAQKAVLTAARQRPAAKSKAS